jgi:hypothetical protein
LLLTDNCDKAVTNLLTDIDKYLNMSYKVRYKPVTNLLTTYMNKPIGGRGRKAPYETTHVRIPVNLKTQVELLVEQFRDNGYVVENHTIENSSSDSDEFMEKMIHEFKKNNLIVIQNTNEISQYELMSHLNLKLEESIKLANELLATRATKKEVVNKLLTALFGIEVKL